MTKHIPETSGSEATSRPTAKVILDSVSEYGDRLTTMEVKLHRMVLAELNTHRAFSRSSASSRAIPIAKQMERVLEDPAMPVFWGKNQKGMGAAVELKGSDLCYARYVWLGARDRAVDDVSRLLESNLHKQLANRLLEPFLWHTVIVSATEWANFFAQRLAINPETGMPYAQPEMYCAALQMWRAREASTPTPLKVGEWHLPYIFDDERRQFGEEDLKLISAARCARVSYLTHDGKRDPHEDISLAERLATAKPMHPSPFEHVAKPWYSTYGNFNGWTQFRAEFPAECVWKYDGPDVEIDF